MCFRLVKISRMTFSVQTGHGSFFVEKVVHIERFIVFEIILHFPGHLDVGLRPTQHLA
jgi:hypothetical protein